jgi:hypothetical protein
MRTEESGPGTGGSRSRARNITCLSVLLFQLISLASCGYSIIGSRHLPFNSITINPVVNRTYEPRLEERLHNALTKEFLDQGIKVMAAGGDITLDATVTAFMLRTIAAVDEHVKEQEVILRVDVRLDDKGKVTEFTSVKSPIRVTFETAGTVSDHVVQKERAIDKAFSEISKEIVSNIIIQYVK